MIPSGCKTLFLCLMSSWTIVRAESQSHRSRNVNLDAEIPVVMETPQERILEEECFYTPTSGSELHYQMQILQKR